MPSTKGFFSGLPAPDKSQGKNCKGDWVLFSHGHSFPLLLCLHGAGSWCLSDFLLHLLQFQNYPHPFPQLPFKTPVHWGNPLGVEMIRAARHKWLNNPHPLVCILEKVLQIGRYLMNKGASHAASCCRWLSYPFWAKLVLLESATPWCSCTDAPSILHLWSHLWCELRKANFHPGRERMEGKNVGLHSE